MLCKSFTLHLPTELILMDSQSFPGQLTKLGVLQAFISIWLGFFN